MPSYVYTITVAPFLSVQAEKSPTLAQWPICDTMYSILIARSLIMQIVVALFLQIATSVIAVVYGSDAGFVLHEVSACVYKKLTSTGAIPAQAFVETGVDAVGIESRFPI